MQSAKPRKFQEKTVSLAELHDVLVEANINPRTGLSTDYLNHFNEMVMMVELYPSSPDVKDEILAWRLLNYRQHFELSGFRSKALALLGYEMAQPGVKKHLDAIVAELDTVLLSAQAAVASEEKHGDSTKALQEASEAVEVLIARASAVINGLAGADEAEADDAQAAVDALFGA
jgi:hypothetical protein